MYCTNDFSFRYKEYDTEEGPWEPISGAASALMGSITGMMMGVADVPMNVFQSNKKTGSKTEGDNSSAGTAGSESSRTALGSQRSVEQQEISPEDIIATGKGVGRVVTSGIGSYMNFTLALAKGFHNAPKLYGDTTVRPHEKISGFSSGLRVAGKVCLSLDNQSSLTW